jgi:acetylornithine/N-succinyldiaminopimelate aminotransferase
MGRLGTLFAFQTFDVRPDLITMAKALANGLPIGAVLIDASCASGLQPGDHGTTFGGSPVPAAAALAPLAGRDETIDFDGRVIARGHRFERGLEMLAAKHRDVFEAPRGRGLMLGLPVRAPYTTKQFVDAAFARKLLINGAGRNTLRFLPPLIVTDDDIDKALECLANVTMTIVN